MKMTGPEGGYMVPANPQTVVRGLMKVSRSWVLMDSSGQEIILDVDKYAIMHRVQIHARDLRILDPFLSYPSTILGREKAIVVNLEHIKAIITADEVLLCDPLDDNVVPVVEELRKRMKKVSVTRDDSSGDALQSDETAEEDDSPFEFRALEVALEAICSFLSARTMELETAVYPACDTLTSKVSGRNMDRVRKLKNQVTSLTVRVKKVRDELEQLLDDDDDMAELYLSRKIADASSVNGSGAASNWVLASPTIGSKISRASSEDVEELEMLLEAYFIQIDGTLNKLTTLREYIDNTKDYIKIHRDNHRNQLITLQVFLCSGTLCMSIYSLVAGIFGMNIPYTWNKHYGYMFKWVVILAGAFSLVLFMLTILYARLKGYVLLPGSSCLIRSRSRMADQEGEQMVPADPQTAVGGLTKGSRSWIFIDSSGEEKLLDVDKYAIMHRVQIHARDLRILDPVLSYPSTILGRLKAIVVNLEHIKAIITADEVLLRNPLDDNVVPVVEELRRRMKQLNVNRNDTGGAMQPDEAAEDDSPFEFRALEVALEAICSFLSARTVELETAVYPACDMLTAKINGRNLDRVRKSKGQLASLTARVKRIREELEQLLDDDDDMSELYLSRKIAGASPVSGSGIVPNWFLASPTAGSKISRATWAVRGDENDVEELEMLLEAYFTHIDGTLDKLNTLREYIDNTRGYIKIHRDNRRNQLILLEVFLSAGNMCLAMYSLVAGIFGMNIPYKWNDDYGYVFKWVVILSAGVSLVTFVLIIFYARLKGRSLSL